MKINRRTYFAFVVMSLALLARVPLCHAETARDDTSIEDVKRETKELLQTLKAYSVEQRDEALQKTKTALDHLDKRIEALEARIDRDWDKMDTAAREKARANRKALRERRAQVAEWYGKLKGSSVDAWEHVKKGFSDAYRELSDAWEASEKESDANP